MTQITEIKNETGLTAESINGKKMKSEHYKQIYVSY